MSNWIKHDGGPCPVPPETWVKVRLIDGYIIPPSRAGSLSCWKFVDGYRPVDPEEVPAPPVLMASDATLRDEIAMRVLPTIISAFIEDRLQLTTGERWVLAAVNDALAVAEAFLAARNAKEGT